MKRSLLIAILLIAYTASFSQAVNYWQQRVNYKIDVSLIDSEKTLNGFIQMQYFNNSPDTLRFIWLHTWPNAYKNDRTAFSDQLLENGNTSFYFAGDEKRGYMNRLDFKVNKVAASIEDHPYHQDIIKLWLPVPLAPGDSALIETPFRVRLPYNFSRGGYIGNSFQATQWYPKPAVYDRKGWHEMPYLDQGEFYSEFGSYDVQVTVPVEYTIAATGLLKNESNAGSTKTLHYMQDSVHDFAWFADRNILTLHDTLQMNNRVIDVYAYYHAPSAEKWKYSTDYIKAAVRTKNTWLGEYPFNIVSVVEEAGGAGNGGMEYPTITLISTPSDRKDLAEVINHEVGHNWLYGILASNERDHPWMDEGMNSYYDKRFQPQLPLDSSKNQSNFFSKRMPEDPADLLLRSLIAVKKDQPIETMSSKFTELNYNAIAYLKSAYWMKLLETTLGTSMFDSVMHAYYAQWKFRHPYPEDFKKIVEEKSGRNVDSIFSLLSKKGSITGPAKKDLRIKAFGSFKDTDKHNYIFISPAIGYNFYDKLMVGAIFHNYTLPATKFRFIAVPLYATGSGSWNGIGRLRYSLYPGTKGQQLELSVSAARFTVDEFTDSTGKKNYQPFTKLTPSARFVFANKNPRSHVTKFIQWKTFFITETGLNFQRDTTRELDVITYPKEKRYINQLQFTLENNRKLYPYQGTFMAEQGKGFVRLNFTGNYFFNYPAMGGLDLRLFAGKFIYTGDKTFVSQYETDRYHLNMSGPKGYEDYTYSNYFVGRNEFEGTPDRQLMNRDGAFKVRTDFLADKVGRTDDWLSAINVASSLPDVFNLKHPFPVVNIASIKVFCDAGTYAEAWKKDATTGKFLYDAGLQLSLLHNTVNIYFPIIYSKVYRDYFKSVLIDKIFRKNISFSIDLQNLNSRKLIPAINF